MLCAVEARDQRVCVSPLHSPVFHVTPEGLVLLANGAPAFPPLSGVSSQLNPESGIPVPPVTLGIEEQNASSNPETTGTGSASCLSSFTHSLSQRASLTFSVSSCVGCRGVTRREQWPLWFPGVSSTVILACAPRGNAKCF